MKATGILRGLISAAVTLSACSGKDDPDATATTAASTATTSKGSTGSSSNSTGSSSSDAATTSTTDLTASSDGTDTGCNFRDCTDQGDPGDSCDLWAQDCPEGEKCMPWADDGGSVWNATKCFPVDPAPQQPGELCTTVGGGVSGVDNCAKSSMCWDVNVETNEGVCVPFCEGTNREDATCDPGFSCTIPADGILILCLPDCDPLLQNCPGDDLCIPYEESFICVLDSSGEAGFYGDPCEYANTCKPGLYCYSPEFVEDCKGAGCCTPFCDTSKTNTCPGDTQECIPWYEEGMAPPGKETLGICGIPQ